MKYDHSIFIAILETNFCVHYLYMTSLYTWLVQGPRLWSGVTIDRFPHKEEAINTNTQM